MNITINGKVETIEPGNLDALVKAKRLNKDTLVIEHNQKIINRENWGQIQLKENDTLELLSFVGGG